ncbi:FitA-like ribbon-helix-helix domain-containing protein [Anabaena sp. UHCC 0399]|uniref:FitA-like ribbon-helix-helix domain-containing protein n=1 Tax=Anabaena sp. UHCC 0399 TaxID=3110238 RepID=UPI003A4C7CF4
MAIVNVNIPDDLYAQLKELANAENCSVEAIVIRILQNTLQAKAQQMKEYK